MTPLTQAMRITGRVGLCSICKDAPATTRCEAITSDVAVYTFVCDYCPGVTKALAMHAAAVQRGNDAWFAARVSA